MSNKITTVSDTTLSSAAAALCAGELVCFPTETVYALAADARNTQAVEKIYAAKGRAAQNPLAILVDSVARARSIAVFDARAELLATKYFPGPLTLVLPLRADSGISPLVNAGLRSIGVRMPDHPVALEILRQTNCPVIGTSANLSGQPSAIDAVAAANALGDHVAMIVDGGKADIGKASTVVDLTEAQLRILREGNISRADIDAALK